MRGDPDFPIALMLLPDHEMVCSAGGHSVTVLSLADGDFDQPLGRIPVINLSTTLRSLEARQKLGRSS